MSTFRDRGVIDITLVEDGKYILVILDEHDMLPVTDFRQLCRDGVLGYHFFGFDETGWGSCNQ
jgi:hypothetical protein